MLHGPAPSGDEPASAPASAARGWPAFDLDDLKRARSDDPNALGRLFDHYFDRVYSVAHRLVGAPESAQDITQEVFLKVRRHLGRLDITTDLAPWIYTVTVNTCRDHLRSFSWRLSRRSVPIDAHSDLPELSSHSGNPEQALLAAEENARVQAAIQRLPLQLRTSVVLHDFEGLPHEQIARVTGTSHAAARKRHSRALRILADLLGEGATP